MSNKRSCEDMLKVYYGLHPYHTGSNICRYDNYFYKSIKDKFTQKEIQENYLKLKEKYIEFL